MNLFLSLFVSFALLFSGTNQLPAQPETAVTWTLSNLTLETPYDSVTLNPALRFSSAVGSEEVNAHFEIVNGDKVLLPVSGRLTSEEAIFSLGTTGNAFRVSNDTLMELMNVDEDQIPIMDSAAEVIRDYCTLLVTTSDPEYPQIDQEKLLNILIESTGADVTQTQVQVDGQELAAKNIELSLNLENSSHFLDAMMSCGIPEMEKCLQSYLKFLTLIIFEGEDEVPQISSYTQLFEERGMELDGEEEYSLPLTMVYAAEGDLAYQQLFTDVNIKGEKLKCDMESITRGEETTLELSMNAQSSGEAIDYVVSGSYKGPHNAPTSGHFTYNISSSLSNFFGYSARDGQSNSGINQYSTNMVIVQDYTHEDGLKNGYFTLSMTEGNTMNMPEIYRYDSPVENYGAYQESHGGSADTLASFDTYIPDSFLSNPLWAIGAKGMEFNYSESRLEDGSIDGHYTLTTALAGKSYPIIADINRAQEQQEDGSLTTHYDMEVSTDMSQDKLGISFDLNRAEGPVSDLFEGMTVNEFSGESDRLGSLAVGASLMSMTSDLLSLTSDESVAKLIEMTGGNLDSSIVSGLPFDVGRTEEPDPFDEAEKVFVGTIPEYTAPEGYVLQGIDAQQNFLSAIYSSGEHEFEFYISSYLSDDITYYRIEDGSMEEISGNVVSIDHYSDGAIYCADLYTAEGHPITFYFDGYTSEDEVRDILSGLEF